MDEIYANFDFYVKENNNLIKIDGWIHSFCLNRDSTEDGIFFVYKEKSDPTK